MKVLTFSEYLSYRDAIYPPASESDHGVDAIDMKKWGSESLQHYNNLHAECIEWIEANLSGGVYYFTKCSFYFTNPADAVLFKLRFGGYDNPMY